ncbi:MAG TPA: DUF5103 domain-containing protein [Bacteroidia bacterium]|nr:DUF5103 domain-containing protein [Bacteroidia bacterium]
MQVKKLVILILVLFSAVLSKADDDTATQVLRYDNYIYEENIKTVQLFQTYSGDHMPVLGLGANDQLTLLFDELVTQNDYYQYTFIHCNADWTPSDLQPMQYLDGNMFDNIEKFTFSNNTYVKYINYQLQFPTDRMRPKLSGNYLLKVYRNYDETDLILTRRFYIVDSKLTISGLVQPATRPDYRFNRQEIDFTVNTKNYNVVNPFQDTRVVIIQNYWQDNAITGLKPQFVSGQDLVYNYEEENVFGGINEFRFFDTRSLRFASPNVDKKYFLEGSYHAKLIPDEIRAFKRHLALVDFNGKRVIENKDGQDGNIDGDYSWVYFTLQTENLLPDSVYVMGELTDWQIKDEFKMVYNFDKKAYEGKALLKQGFYDYMYVTVPRAGTTESTLPETLFTEGNYFDTENDYYIFYYVRNQFLDYYELLSFHRLNTNTTKR